MSVGGCYFDYYTELKLGKLNIKADETINPKIEGFLVFYNDPGCVNSVEPPVIHEIKKFSPVDTYQDPVTLKYYSHYKLDPTTIFNDPSQKLYYRPKYEYKDESGNLKEVYNSIRCTELNRSCVKISQENLCYDASSEKKVIRSIDVGIYKKGIPGPQQFEPLYNLNNNPLPKNYGLIVSDTIKACRDASGFLATPIYQTDYSVIPDRVFPITSPTIPHVAHYKDFTNITGQNLFVGGCVLKNTFNNQPTDCDFIYGKPDCRQASDIPACPGTDISYEVNSEKFSVARYHGCSIESSNSLYCWGDMFHNAGKEYSTSVSYTGEKIETEDKNWRSVSVGLGYSCAVTNDNQAYCWGDNQFGNVGIGNTINQESPQVVSQLKSTADVATGDYTTCAIGVGKSNIYCWGYGGRGTLGNGLSGSNYFVKSPIVSKVPADYYKDIEVYGESAFALTNSGKIYSWGANSFGQLGNENNFDQTVPAFISNKSNVVFKRLAEGTTKNEPKKIEHPLDHACAISNDDDLYCWGNNDYLQLGKVNLPNGSKYSTIPLKVDLGNEKVSSASVGAFHTCAVTIASASNTSKVLCWGHNRYGILGEEENIVAKSALPLSIDLSKLALKEYPVDLAIGPRQTCFKTNFDKLYCLGYWPEGLLGNLKNDLIHPFASNVKWSGNNSQSASAQKMSVGEHSACFVGLDKAVYCWGPGLFSEVLSEAITPTKVIFPVGVSDDFRDVAVGTYHQCAIHQSGKLYCWGEGTSGQLGNGQNVNSIQAVEVDFSLLGIANQVIQVSLTDYSTCAIHSNQNVYCFGDAAKGVVGIPGNSGIQSRPVPINYAIKNFKQLSCGEQHCYLLGTNGEFVYFGKSGSFAFETGNAVTTFLPVSYQNKIPQGQVLSTITSGNYHVCGKFQKNGVASFACLGSNSKGLSARGGAGSDVQFVAIDSSSIGAPITDIYASRSLTCVKTNDEQNVYCSGDGYRGQDYHAYPFTKLRGVDSFKLVPVDASGFQGYFQLALGGKHSCLVEKNSKKIFCRGAERLIMGEDSFKTYFKLPQQVIFQ